MSVNTYLRLETNPLWTLQQCVILF